MDAVGIRIHALSKRFVHRVRGPVYAVRDVTLAVEPGELLTLLGPSGCGKTTTLRMIAGFERPDAGRISIGEQDVTRLMANERNIGFVFQNYALFPHLTVHENVAYGLRVKKLAEAAITSAVEDVLHMVGLAGYDRQFPHQLSGGEQQRVALARAIVIHPRVLLFDEPLSNLDAKLRVHMRSELRELQKRLSITAVYVTHDQEEAMAISDRIVVMDQGAVVQDGTAEELYYRPASAFVAQFIGRTNLLAGTVVTVTAGGLEIDVAGHRHCLAVDSGPYAAGAAIRLVLRPECITVGPPDTHGLRGTILSRTFLGEKVEYRVRVGDEVLQVTDYGGQASFSVDQPVSLRLPTAGVPILRGDGA